MSVLLPREHNLQSTDLQSAQLEEMWEPDDWDEEQVTFEPLCIDAQLSIKPLPATARQQKLPPCPVQVQLL